MNDNELFELCREVFEKTGLEGDGDTNYEMQYDIAHYTSDYLLEKLPSPLIQHWGGEPIGFQLQLIDASSQTEKSWVAQYWHSDEMTEGLSEADTPLKALLKLTLALHEAGELK